MSLLKTAVLLGALSVPTLASPFQYGDIFITTAAGILRYNQSGTLLQTIPGGGGLAFDSAGNLYAGTQKYDNSGNPLGTFVSGFPGVFANPTDIAFDSSGNAYVAGIQDLNFDFVSKFTGGGAPIGSQSYLQGQESFPYINVAPNGEVLVTPGTSTLIYVINAGTLALQRSINNPSGGAYGGLQGLAGGGFVVANQDINQFDSAGNKVFTYSAVFPSDLLVHSDFISVASFTPTNFWAVTDFGEVRSFNLGTATPVSGFNAISGEIHGDIAIYTIPEPGTILGFASGLPLLWMIRRRAHSIA